MTKIDLIKERIESYRTQNMQDDCDHNIDFDEIRIRTTKLIDAICDIVDDGYQIELPDDIQLHISPNKKITEFQKRKWQMWMKYDGTWCIKEIYTDYYAECQDLDTAMKKLKELTNGYLGKKPPIEEIAKIENEIKNWYAQLDQDNKNSAIGLGPIMWERAANCIYAIEDVVKKMGEKNNV